MSANAAAPAPVAINSVYNWRDLSNAADNTSDIIKPGVLYRSAKLCNKKNGKSAPSAADLAKLSRALAGGVVIDLRDHNKTGSWGSCKDEKSLKKLKGVSFVSRPAIGKASGSGYILAFVGKNLTKAEKAAEAKQKPRTRLTYKQTRVNLGKAITDIANADGPVVFHCAAGKDRTGWIATMVYFVMGADKSTILKAYTNSNKHLPNGERVKKEWLTSALSQVNKNFSKKHTAGWPSRSTVLKYLKAKATNGKGSGLGVSQAAIDKLIVKLKPVR